MVDVLTATSSELRQQLQNGAVTSVLLVEKYLEQIQKHNHNGLGLRALTSCPPKDLLIHQAKKLDAERAAGNLRSELHGIPIVVKDALMTHPSLGMTTTHGYVALRGCEPKTNAAVVDQLLEAGMIVLGKASLTEGCGLRGTCMTVGYSAVHGQTQSPYIKGGADPKDLFTGRSLPGGSSAGSAVGVAAGFAPLSIGTDTCGSIVMPAGRHALYSLKPTLGDVSSQGIWPLSPYMDSAGGMAKSPRDLALLTELILTPLRKRTLPEASGLFDQCAKQDIRIGFVDPDKNAPFKGSPVFNEEWQKQIGDEYRAAVDRIREAGVKAVIPCRAIDTSNFPTFDKGSVHHIAFGRLRYDIDDYLKNLDKTDICSLHDLVEFNKSNAVVAMPEPHSDQNDLIDALNNRTTKTEVANVANTMYHRCTKALEAVMSADDLNMLAWPSDGGFIMFPCFAGWPYGTVPLGYLPNGMPQGITVCARPQQEGLLIAFMREWEQHFKREPPPMLWSERQN